VVKIQGWVIGLANRAVAVRLDLNGQPLRQKKLTMVRPDVCATYPGAKERGRCGFRFRIPFTALPERFVLDVLAIFENGSQEVFALIKGWYARLDTQAPKWSAAGLLSSAIDLMAKNESRMRAGGDIRNE
jgi:hypothetical protein